MTSRFAAILLVSTTLAAGTAAAQTTPAPSTTATHSGQFVTEQTTGEYRASKFIGLAVYGSENQKIGDINEILMDQNGNAKAVVVGVGGFLGIGEKNVAVPFSSVEWVNTRPNTTAGNNAATNHTATTGTVGGTAMNTAPAATTTARDVTGSTAPTRDPAAKAAYNGYPDHAMVRMSKADLQSAPAFKYYADTHSSRGTTSNATGSNLTTAPKQ